MVATIEERVAALEAGLLETARSVGVRWAPLGPDAVEVEAPAVVETVEGGDAGAETGAGADSVAGEAEADSLAGALGDTVVSGEPEADAVAGADSLAGAVDADPVE